MLERIVITESPRDGMQGLTKYIPVLKKVEYINLLLKLGFDIIDTGSFVSPEIIPQLKDTYDVLEKLDISSTSSKLMVLVPNVKGAEIAVNIRNITYLSFPFSISSTFLKLNINSDFDKAQISISKINDLCRINDKKLKVYITMAFGNPYSDDYNIDIITRWADVFSRMGIRFISLSDVTGISTRENITEIFSFLIKNYPDIEFGFHLHCAKDGWNERLDAAFKAGCRSFEAVINGFGGCPMTNYEMVNNLDTGNLLNYLNEMNVPVNYDKDAFNKAVAMSKELFDN